MKQLKTVNNYIQYEDDCGPVLQGYNIKDLIFLNLKGHLQFFSRNDTGYTRSLFSFDFPFYLNDEVIDTDNYLVKLSQIFNLTT